MKFSLSLLLSKQESASFLVSFQKAPSPQLFYLPIPSSALSFRPELHVVAILLWGHRDVISQQNLTVSIDLSPLPGETEASLWFMEGVCTSVYVPGLIAWICSYQNSTKLPEKPTRGYVDMAIYSGGCCFSNGLNNNNNKKELENLPEALYFHFFHHCGKITLTRKGTNSKWMQDC